LFIGVTLLAALTLAVEVAERARAEGASRRAETRRAEAELAGMHAAANERRRIARETHDIVGHGLNVMILSSGAARRLVDRDAEKARELLSTVEDVGREAFRDLDVALGLTDTSPDFAPLKGLADLDELVARLVRAGMQVEYEVEGSPQPLPRLVDGSAYRIIQESLTNVAKHSTDARTNVQVRFGAGALFLEVTDRGRNSGVRDGRNGRGLSGMRERVAVLGGRLEAGPIADDGYIVVVELPLEQV
jgi:signal transduction histidine kinase